MVRLLDEVQQNYKYLVPSKTAIAVLLLLSERVSNREIDRHFTHEDIVQAVKNVSSSQKSEIQQTEKVLKTLLENFIERPTKDDSLYKLTEYARKFIKLILSKLDNPFRNFSLIDSFEKYADFKAVGIENIEQFESWFEQGFNSAYRQTIIDHLEALKDETKEHIRKLNIILDSEEKDALEMATEFKNVFKSFGDKARDIQDALKIGIRLDIEIKQVCDRFYEEVEKYDYSQSTDNEDRLDLLNHAWKRASLIQNEVRDFFEEIEEKLSQLRGKIVFASDKLNDLQEYFRYQSKFKLNLKKLLEFTLKESKYSGKGIVLPDLFPNKVILFEPFKLLYLPDVDSLFMKNNAVIHSNYDREYQAKERGKIDFELQQQEKVSRWIEQCKSTLELNGKLNFTECFYQILKLEKDVNIPVSVGIELFEYAQNSPDYSISINKIIDQKYSEEKIKIWQMNIKAIV